MAQYVAVQPISTPHLICCLYALCCLYAVYVLSYATLMLCIWCVVPYTSLSYRVCPAQDQPGKFTTKELWNEHFREPWDCFSLASHDHCLPDAQGGVSLSGCLPSNQCQESWHKKGVKKILAGCLRASTADVLTKSLPKILLNDSVSMPDKLNFEVRHYNPRMIRKALKYLNLKAPESHIKSLYSPSTKVCKHAMLSYFVLCCTYALLMQQ